MNSAAIIFSRLDSKRLPRKAFSLIDGKFLLQRVIDRAKKINGIDKLILATSDREIDKGIIKLAKKNKIDFFAGNLNDVALRAYNTCKKYNIDSFVRICGDRPFFDPVLISKLLLQHIKSDFDITTTMFPKTLPAGLTIEILNFEALKKIIKLNNDLSSREHITQFIYKNPQKFKLNNYNEKRFENYKDLRFVIDNYDDLERTKWVLNKLKLNNKSEYDIMEIIRLTKEWNKLKI